MEQGRTVGEDLPIVMARVRDEIMPLYLEIGPAGSFAVAMMRADLDKATKALAEGDIVTILQAYESLKSYKA